jgi:Transposase zinc-binding domain
MAEISPFRRRMIDDMMIRARGGGHLPPPRRRVSRRASGSLSNSQRRVMAAIGACRTAALGGHVEQCEDCGKSRITSIPALWGAIGNGESAAGRPVGRVRFNRFSFASASVPLPITSVAFRLAVISAKNSNPLTSLFCRSRQTVISTDG